MRLLRALVSVAVLSTLFVAPVPAPAAEWTPPALKIAVVRSQPTIDWVAKYRPGKYPHSAKEVALRDYLISRGWDVTEIGDDDCRDLATLKQFDVVVLPYVFCMDSTPNLTLLRYVSEGGGLVSVLASPRIAPGWPVPPSDISPIEKWKWGRVMGSTAWSWGPLSEAYQVRFIDDNFVPKFDVSPRAHAIVSGASAILQARGFDGSRQNMGLVRDPGGGLELLRQYSNNPNAVRFLDFTIHDTTVTSRYPDTYAAGIASEYKDGRTVFFPFAVMDFFRNANTALYSRQTPAGTPQGEVAGAYLESALQWAATDDGKAGSVIRDARTYAVVDVYEKAIYAHQYLTNAGNIPTSGQLSWRVYDPSGKLVSRWDRYYTPSVPGTTQRFSQKYNPGVRLKSGKYRVQVSYKFTYPTYKTTYVEEVYVTRAQGQDIHTKLYCNIKPSVTQATFGPDPLTPNGDGFTDRAYINYKVSAYSVVDVKVYDARWNLVAQPVKGQVRAPNRLYSVAFNGLSKSGAKLPSGYYYYSVQSRNNAGSVSRGGVFYQSLRLYPGSTLGTRPDLSGVAASPSSFTPNGDGDADVTIIGYTLDEPAWVTVKAVSSKGEVKTIANGYRAAGAHSETWNGKDSAGRDAPSGTYRFFVFASGGGTSAAYDLADGTVKLAR